MIITYIMLKFSVPL